MGACGGDDSAAPDDGGTEGSAMEGSVDSGPDTSPVPSPFGLDARPSNKTCVAPARPPNTAPVKFVRVLSNVALSQPMHMAQIPGDATRFFVIQRGGTMVSFPTTSPPATPTTVLTVPKTVNTNGEGGLLGFAFHPNFKSNGYVYFSYTTDGGSTGMRSVIARMTSKDDGATFDPASYVEILGPFEQPYTNHDGGDLHFGPFDGYLYASFGDGGSGGDPLGHGQNTNLFFSKILRIDVDHPQGGMQYGIPSDNPFATAGGEPATYAYGLRNPFRFSIDRGTGHVWVGDVGQNAWEEVDELTIGGDYGWNTREGKHCYSPMIGCPTAGLIDPVWDYDHGQGQAVIGGVLYRGKALPTLVGKYVVGDYGSSAAWFLTDQGDGTWSPTAITDRGGAANWVAFTEDQDGEIYGLSLTQGAIYQLVAAGAQPPSTFPDTLTKTGCVDPADPTKPYSGVIPYEPISKLWSDGADKGRWMGVPDGKQITVGADGDFAFPNGTVLMKSFSLGGKLIETRLLIHHDDGGWAGYSYEWNDAQTDAALLPDSKTKVVGAQTWYFPGRAECNRCHTTAAGNSLGLEVLQLNDDYVYTQTNRVSNQLATLDHIGMFDKPIGAPSSLPALPSVTGADPIESRARSYLHANCSFCHRPTGGGGGNLDLRFETAFASSNACGTAPQTGDLGIMGAKVIAPGDPAHSVLVQRPLRLDSNRMPPVASHVVDTTGTGVLSQWVMGLSSCPGPVDAGGD